MRASIKAEIDAYVVGHPQDYRGIDALQFKYRGSHIAVMIAGVPGELTADEAADWMASHQGNEIVPMGTIPTPTLTITKQAISGGLQFWGWWNFPDWWAGQGSPNDLAAITVSTHTCTRTQHQAVWTYDYTGHSTGLGSLRTHAPNQYVMWNIADYTVNFASQADHGLTRLEVVRTASCSGSINVGAAFDYEANQGGGLGAISISFGVFSVTYDPTSPTHGHWGIDPIWGWA